VFRSAACKKCMAKYYLLQVRIHSKPGFRIGKELLLVADSKRKLFLDVQGAVLLCSFSLLV
jgi:hypothetical protein